MKITTDRTFYHSIAWTPAALRTISSLVHDLGTSGQDSDSALTTHVLAVRKGGAIESTSIEMLLADRNEVQNEIKEVRLLRRREGEPFAVVIFGESSQQPTRCILIGKDDSSHDALVAGLLKELANCRTFYSTPRELLERILQYPIARFCWLAAFLLCLFFTFKECLSKYQADRYLSRPEAQRAIRDADPSKYPADEAEKLRSLQGELRSENIRVNAWKHGVPISTIIWGGIQLLGILGVVCVFALYRHWFPTTQFRIGEGEERYQRGHRFQFWVCATLITAILIPLARAVL